MNRADLVASIADDTGLSKGQVSGALDSLVDNLQKALSGGDKVTLVGFGTFGVSERAARTGRNPQTGAPIQIPARKAVKFTPGKSLKDAIQ